MGKYLDKDYSLEGLGQRMDNVEDLIKGVVEPVAKIGKLIERWAPIMVVAAVSSGWIGGKFGAFLDAVTKLAGWH